MLVKPEVVIKELKSDSITFDLRNTNVGLANALNRIMIAEIPTMSIDSVEIEENSSNLNDEFLAHRLALIPLVSSDADTYLYSNECACNDMRCDLCSIELTLDVRCPSGMNQRNVTSNDFQIPSKSKVKPINYIPVDYVPTNYATSNEHNSKVNDSELSSYDSTLIDNPPILIAKLRENQQIKLTAIARKGIGKDHSKWSPSVGNYYKNEPVISIQHEKLDCLKEEERDAFQKQIVASCPNKILSYDKVQKIVDIEDAFLCTSCNECKNKAKQLGVSDYMSITHKDDQFRFYVGTSGALSPVETVTKAIRILQDKLTTIRTSVRDLDPR